MTVSKQELVEPMMVSDESPGASMVLLRDGATGDSSGAVITCIPYEIKGMTRHTGELAS